MRDSSPEARAERKKGLESCPYPGLYIQGSSILPQVCGEGVLGPLEPAPESKACSGPCPSRKLLISGWGGAREERPVPHAPVLPRSMPAITQVGGGLWKASPPTERGFRGLAQGPGTTGRGGSCQHQESNIPRLKNRPTTRQGVPPCRERLPPPGASGTHVGRPAVPRNC